MAFQDFDQLHSQIDTTVHTDGPTGKTTAAGLNALLHRLVADLPAASSLPVDQLVALAAAINPNASNPYATIADLANLPNVGSSVTIEQDLISNSTNSVPSVAAVRAAADAANSAFQVCHGGLEVLAVAQCSGTISARDFNTVPIRSPLLDVRPSGTSGGWDMDSSTYMAPISGTYELQTNIEQI